MTTKATEYICIKDDQLQNHSRKIERLEARSELREKTINEIKLDMEKMDKKLDVLLQGFNDFKMQSTHDDTKLELRLNTIETKIKAQEEATRETREEFNKQIDQQLTKLGLFFSFIVIIIQIIPLLLRIFNL